jgi:hypothetical protein
MMSKHGTPVICVFNSVHASAKNEQERDYTSNSQVSATTYTVQIPSTVFGGDPKQDIKIRILECKPLSTATFLCVRGATSNAEFAHRESDVTFIVQYPSLLQKQTAYLRDHRGFIHLYWRNQTGVPANHADQQWDLVVELTAGTFFKNEKLSPEYCFPSIFYSIDSDRISTVKETIGSETVAVHKMPLPRVARQLKNCPNVDNPSVEIHVHLFQQNCAFRINDKNYNDRLVWCVPGAREQIVHPKVKNATLVSDGAITPHGERTPVFKVDQPKGGVIELALYSICGTPCFAANSQWHAIFEMTALPVVAAADDEKIDRGGTERSKTISNRQNLAAKTKTGAKSTGAKTAISKQSTAALAKQTIGATPSMKNAIAEEKTPLVGQYEHEVDPANAVAGRALVIFPTELDVDTFRLGEPSTVYNVSIGGAHAANLNPIECTFIQFVQKTGVSTYTVDVSDTNSWSLWCADKFLENSLPLWLSSPHQKIAVRTNEKGNASFLFLDADGCSAAILPSCLMVKLIVEKDSR